MNYQKEEIESKNIDHLGIIAGIIDEIGIVEKINELFLIDSREKVNTGEVVKAIILNGLGFVSRPLYLFPEFFKDKAIENLIGDGIKASDLNDDKIGRVMDKIYKYGLTKLFLFLALSVVNKYEIETKYSHLDSTSLHLHGDYKNSLNNLDQELRISGENPIIITQGYSRDHRPDLKQCILDLIVSSDGDIPLFFRGASGNESDKAVFAHILVEYSKQIDFDAIFYVLLEGVRWRSLPGDFPPWQTVYTYFRNWRKDGTWLHIHDNLREYTRIEAERYPSPSEAIIDSQSVKSAAIA